VTDYRLVYYSANRLTGSAAEVEAEIGQILATSRRNNDAVGVTGALLFSDGLFAQVLEGPQAVVEATFERIQRDDRHGDVQLLEFTAIDERSFQAWSMGYVHRTGADRVIFDTTPAAGSPGSSGQLLVDKLRALLIERSI